jgi:hypothetical protein
MTIDINLYTGKSSTRLPAYWEEGEQESRAFLYLDLEGEGEMWIGSKSPSNNCWGMREHWGIQRTYSVPNNLTEVGYNNLMQHQRVTSLAKIIHEDSEVVWDGSNYRIKMGNSAEVADWALEAFCNSIEPGDFESLQPVCASHYLVDGTYEALMSSGGTEGEVAQRIVAEAAKDGFFLTVRNVEITLERMKNNEEA